MGRLSQIKTSVFKKFLKKQGLTHISTKGSHERWNKTPSLLRPVIIVAGKKEISPGVVKNSLKTLGVSVEDFLKDIGKLK